VTHESKHDHSEYVLARVLLEIADDFEELNQILIQLNRHTGPLVFLREEIKEALCSLLERGWARAYDLWSSSQDERFPVVESPPFLLYDKLYFWITPEGLDAVYKYPKKWFPTWNED
jgi:hypothetical protein